MSYDKYYEEQREEGEEFQDFVQDQLWSCGLAIQNYTSKKWQQERGENRAGVEIKHDKKYAGTGNLYIEVAEKSDPGNQEYVLSGIRRKAVWLLVIGNYEILFVFSARFLELLISAGKLERKVKSTSIGYLLPEKMARGYAARVIEV